MNAEGKTVTANSGLEIPRLEANFVALRRRLIRDDCDSEGVRLVLASDTVENPEEVYLTSAQLARYLGVSRQAVDTYKIRGLLPEPVYMFGNSLKRWYRLSDIDALLRRCLGKS